MVQAIYGNQNFLSKNQNIGPVNLLKNLIKSWSKYQQTISQLSNLDSERLADIGISKEQIKSFAYKACFKKAK